MENENEVDQLFKNGLNDPEIPFNELDWKRMERKLDAKDKKRVVPLWMFTASGIAAVLTVILLWFFSKPLIYHQKIKKEGLVQQSLPKLSKKPADQNSAAGKIPASVNTAEQNLLAERPAAGQRLNITEKTVSNEGLDLAQPIQHPAQKEPVRVKQDLDMIKQHLNTAPVYLAKGITTLNIYPLPLQKDSDAILAQKANALAQSKDPLERPRYNKPGIDNQNDLSRSIHKNMDAAMAQSHALILSAMAAPDISTAKSSKSSKISSNVGMLATYALGHKISLTSGAIYAKKYYNSTGTTTQNNQYSTTTNTWEVDAYCNVLDIPLNVNYKLLNNKKLSVSVNTGLSSYFMLKEKYDFITDQQNGTQKVSTLEINNQNQHLFGIANVSVSFDHHITNSVSVGVQPFAKLPLTGIGYGDASLKSAGVSFSLNIGLFPAKKPGKYASLR